MVPSVIGRPVAFQAAEEGSIPSGITYYLLTGDNMPYKDKQKQKEAQRQYYERNKNKVNERSQQRKNKTRRFIEEYKKTLECMLCGENHPACLEFHHRDPLTKSYDISDMARDVRNINKVLEEIAKCDVLCSNCHKKLHCNLKH